MVFTGRQSTAQHSHEHSGRERLCDGRIGGRWWPRWSSDGWRFVCHRAVHRRGRCRYGRFDLQHRWRSTCLSSARRAIGLWVAVWRRGHLQPAIRPVMRRRQPCVPHSGVVGTAGRRRRNRPDQRTAGE